MEIGTALSILLDALNEELTRDGTREDMCLVSVMPGADVPIDYALEDCAGMAWVRMVNAAPSVIFPNADALPQNCAYTLAYGIEMGVLRTAPTPTMFGSDISLPEPEDHFEAAQAQFKDLDAMHRALRNTGAQFEDFLIGTYTPSGPDGGAVGGSWTATIGLD